MNIRRLKKYLYLIFISINLSPQVIAGDFYPVKRNTDLKLKKISWTKVNNNYSEDKEELFFKEYKENVEKSSLFETEKTKQDSSLPFVNNFENRDELEIQSEIQSEVNNVLYAEGNVLVTYKGFLLRADNIVYDKTKNIINAEGNISLVFGEQLINMVNFEYDFNKDKGYLLEVDGLIKTSNLVGDLYSNDASKDIQILENLKRANKIKALHTPNKVENWSFSSEKIEINGDKWLSSKIILTNDLLNSKQVRVEINSFEAMPKKQEIEFKSTLNYLILDEKLKVPFWFGNRTLTKSPNDFDSKNSWIVGYENLDKDGVFIGRSLNSINLSNDFVLSLEPQFLIQRSFKGYTKSFVNKGDSITGEKVKRDTTFADYFALESQIKGKINNWDLKVSKLINSFDSEKFIGAVRFNSSLSKEINFLNSKWDKTFYGIYRDRVWNGSIGDAEIYKGYGSKLEKQNTWNENGIKKIETLSVGMANLKAESLESKNIVSSLKANFFYSLDQKFPIEVVNPSSKYIDTSYEFIPEPIQKGLSLNTKIELLYSLYEGGNSQGYIGFGAGPELIFGNFKNNFFDYTRLSLLPFYKLKDGNSIFKFDHVSDKFILDIALDQQLFGPFLFKSSAVLNLDSDSDDYGDFIDSKISLNWKKRSYELGIYYQPNSESGGIAFTLFGFK